MDLFVLHAGLLTGIVANGACRYTRIVLQQLCCSVAVWRKEEGSFATEAKMFLRNLQSFCWCLVRVPLKQRMRLRQKKHMSALAVPLNAAGVTRSIPIRFANLLSCNAFGLASSFIHHRPLCDQGARLLSQLWTTRNECDELR